MHSSTFPLQLILFSAFPVELVVLRNNKVNTEMSESQTIFPFSKRVREAVRISYIAKNCIYALNCRAKFLKAYLINLYLVCIIYLATSVHLQYSYECKYGVYAW